MNGRQVAEWEAYYQIEPFGEYQAFWRAGLIASMIANALRGKGQTVLKPEDFIPRFKGQRQKQDVKSMKTLMSGQFGNFTKRDFMRARRKQGKKRKRQTK